MSSEGDTQVAENIERAVVQVDAGCGQGADGSRKASTAIDVKSLLVRKKDENASERCDFFQFTSGPVQVNGLLRSDEGAGFGAVRHMPAPMESHLFQ